jgi:WD40 repeat protein
VAFTPDGKRVVVCTGVTQTPRDCPAVFTWDIRTRKMRRLDLPRGAGLTYWTSSLLDGRTLLIGGTRETAALFDLQTGKRVGTIPGSDRPRLLAASADGRWLLAAGHDHALRAYDLRRKKLVGTIHEHLGEVTAVAVSADGRWCASATADKRLWVFDRANGKERGRAPTLFRTGASFLRSSPDGKALVAAGDGPRGGVEVWDWQASRDIRRGYAAAGQPDPDLATLRKDFVWLQCAALSADGRALLTSVVPSGTADGTKSVVQVWDLAPPKAADEGPKK